MVEVAIEVLNRNAEIPIFLESIGYKTEKTENINYDILLENNIKQQFKKTYKFRKIKLLRSVLAPNRGFFRDV